MQRIINFIKTHKLAYLLLFYCGSIAIRFISLFVKTDKKSVLFISFGGRKFDDSPKAIYEQMCKDEFFNNYKFIWALRNPNEFNVGLRGRKIKIDTIKFIIEALRAKIWITNSSIERGLSFKKKYTIMINTWHGTPLKKICQEENGAKYNSFQTKENTHIDIMTAQSQHDATIFARLFNVKENDIFQCDLPRNDILTKAVDVECLKTKIGIPKGKKVLLYAPTYREYERDETNACILNIPINFNKWHTALGDDYVILLRAHYEVVKILNIGDNSNIINVSSYPTLSDLMFVSDILISDYSSMFFDYCIMGKPMLCFAYDLEEYSNKRGLYLNLDSILSGYVVSNEDDLLKKILNLNEKEACILTKRFRATFAPNAGNAATFVVEKLKEKIIEKR